MNKSNLTNTKYLLKPLTKFSQYFSFMLPNFLKKFSIPWILIISYLSIILVLPMAALIIKSLGLGPAKFMEIASSKVAISAYEVTFFTALMAAFLNGLMGTLIAWVLVRYEFFGKKFCETIVDLPFALPTSVAGLVLATIYSEKGWIGQFFTPFGIKIAFTRLGIFVAMVFISLPFIVRTVQPVLQETDRQVEEASYLLGASTSQTFFKVILPPLIPPILTGISLGFSRAVGEYGSVVLISSNIPLKDLIAPVLVFQRLEEYDTNGATVIGTVLLLISLIILLLINFLQKWERSYADS